MVWDILSKRHWDTQEECRLLGSILDLLNQSLWGWGSGICILNMFPWNMSCIIKHTMHTLLCKPQCGLVDKHSKLFFFLTISPSWTVFGNILLLDIFFTKCVKRSPHFTSSKSDKYTKVYNWHIYKLYPPNTHLDMIHITFNVCIFTWYLLQSKCKLILITLVQCISDTRMETYTNIFKTKAVFFSSKTPEGHFFSTQVPTYYFMQKCSKTNCKGSVQF